MIKASFFVRMKDHVELVKGYKERFIDYARRDAFVGVYHYAYGEWRISCLLTGYMICTGRTRKEAIERFHNTFESKYDKLLSMELDCKSFINKKTYEMACMQRAYYEHEREKVE